MGVIQPPSPVLLIVAVSSRHATALEWARQQMEAIFGPLALASDAFDFTETDYYAATMGTDLKKQFFAVDRLIDAGRLAEIKWTTNQWETQYAAQGQHAEARPLNLDPGYITPAKLILASTKDHAHRIYLHEGIFAEITLSYRGGRWEPQPWTYPDYRRADFQDFFTRCRQYLLDHRTD